MKNLNTIKDKTKEVGASSVLLSVLFDINASTVSGWNSNTNQPNLSIINEIAEFLEIPNSELIISKPRKNSGLARATQIEFKRLLDEGLSHKIPSKDKKGNPIEINNPELVEKIRDFVKNYKLKK